MRGSVTPAELAGEIASVVYGTDDIWSIEDARWLGIITLALDGKTDDVRAAVWNIVERRAAAKRR